MEAYRTHIENSFTYAENYTSKISDDIIRMEGMTGTKTRHFYNNLISIKDARYLEIGTWKGSSVCSAMYGNSAKVTCIDNWSDFGGPKDEFLINFNKFKGENDANFIENDCFKVDVSSLSKYNIYMYDGYHASESHYKALSHYCDCLDDVFIYIVDDWNWQDVRDGTTQAIKELGLYVLYEKEIRLTIDNSITPEPQLSQTWWNGIYVAILKKSNTLRIDYKFCSSDLCELGRKYDTDKSSQRNNVTDYRHCHPYTLFYENLFRNKKDHHLKIAEMGIGDGASLRMFQEYFKNAEIYGFEYNLELIDRFKNNFNNDRISLSTIDVTDANSIRDAFQKMDMMYDIIIEDTTHQFEDQIRVIEHMYKYVKPGGVLIIEDIFKSYNENDYITRLRPILSLFQDYFFVELDHVNKNSTGWNNDKLFVLVKDGGEPIFKNPNKITIITPSYRVDNLLKLKDTINFDYVDEWIIVYDQTKISENPNIFNNSKIKEYCFKGEGISGNPQRNYGMTKVTNPNTMIYYLDDDNLIHPNMYKLLNIIDNTKIYTFNQVDGLKGNDIRVGHIDTAMFMVPYSLCKNETWIINEYAADGFFIEKCYKNNVETHVFVDNALCYWNKLA